MAEAKVDLRKSMVGWEYGIAQLQGAELGLQAD